MNIYGDQYIYIYIARKNNTDLFSLVIILLPRPRPVRRTTHKFAYYPFVHGAYISIYIRGRAGRLFIHHTDTVYAYTYIHRRS